MIVRSVDLQAWEQYCQEVSWYLPLRAGEESIVVERARAGMVEAQQRLIESQLLYVLSVAKGYATRGGAFSVHDALDYVQAGNEAICKCVDKALCRPSPVAYLRAAVKSAVYGYCIENRYAIRVPAASYIQDRCGSRAVVAESLEKLFEEEGFEIADETMDGYEENDDPSSFRSPIYTMLAEGRSFEEIAEQIGMEPEMFKKCLERVRLQVRYDLTSTVRGLIEALGSKWADGPLSSIISFLLMPAQAYGEIDQQSREREIQRLAEELKAEGVIRSEQKKGTKFKDRRRELAQLLERHPGLTTRDVAYSLGISKTTAADWINRLNAEGAISRVAPSRPGLFEKHRDELIQLLRINPRMTTFEGAQHFQVSRSAVHRWMVMLKAEGVFEIAS